MFFASVGKIAELRAKYIAIFTRIKNRLKSKFHPNQIHRVMTFTDRCLTAKHRKILSTE